MKYEVLDDIVYEAGRHDGGQPKAAQATEGDVVELTEKDAKALLARGAIRPATEAEANHATVAIVPPKQPEE